MTVAAAGATGHGSLVPTLEIGGTHVTAGLVGRDAHGGLVVLAAHRAHLDASAPAEQIIGRIVSCAQSIAAPELRRWVVAVPGPFDYQRGVALYQDVDKFDALHGLDLRRALLRRLPSRPSDVVFLNDAHAFLRGEWQEGAARGHDRAVGLTLGTGIGSAFLSGGAVVTDGPLVPTHGHVHLLSVRGRPLEEAVSSRAIRRLYVAAAKTEEIDVAAISQLARSGDPKAQAALQGPLTTLGQALAPWLERFAATVLVVGGSIARSWDLIAEPLEDGIRSQWSRAAQLTLLPAQHPEEAALIGAASILTSHSPHSSGGTGACRGSVVHE